MTCRTALLSAGLVALIGCGGGGGAQQASSTRSFDVDVIFNWSGSAADFAGNRDLLVARQRLTFTLASQVAGQAKLIVGGRGVTATVPVTVGSGGRVAYSNNDPGLLDQQRTTFKVAVPRVGTECTFLLSLSFLRLEFETRGSKLTGLATGFVQYQDGDSIGTIPFDAGLSVASDTVGPTLVAPLPTELAVHPFDGMAIDFVEALAVTVSARLDDGAAAFPLTALPDAYPSRFVTTNTLLPFGRHLQIAFASLTDLAGNAGSPPTAQVVTPALPGPFVGFDGAAPGLLLGTARVVDQTTIPVLAESKALLLDSLQEGGRFTARLTIPAGASSIVIIARTLGSPVSGGAWVTAKMGTVGGPIVELSHSLSWNAPATADSGLAAFPLISQAVRFQEPLPAGITGEAIVDFSSRLSGCGGLLTPGALLIESLAIE